MVLATHVLQGIAGDWWRLVRRTTLQGHDIREITWDEFRALFLEKFFPRYSRDRCYQEFLALTQGDSTVEEYTHRFIELRRFSPHQDERDMAQRFMRFNPPHYKGSSDSEDAEFWVQEIEQLFSLLECLDRERVVLATHVLQGGA